ncbi:MAG: C69 family dipeptidase, partial [Atribacterota bacterium]|nr:C69 family dipeptidase [Atribacterota bacterium]
MCDTIVALGPATEEGFTLFGKNSDREPDEAQNIIIVPHKEHDSNETIQCAYLTIPQASETARVLLCQPFWMFGAEMGANEYGVVIGNEAIFTRETPDKIGLTGMDLVRLVLERSQTARQALEVIIELLEKHGQGGNCGYRFKLKYMNSFLIADKKEAYVLETVKTWWAWKKIKDVWSISNIISLQRDYDSCSEELIDNAVKKGYCKKGEDFNFQKCYSAKFMTWAAKGAEREKRSRALLLRRKKRLTTRDLINILRDHGENSQWTPNRGPGATLCLHSADKLFRRTQTVCSLIAKTGEGGQFFYTTGVSNPCMSPFFPIFSPDTTVPAEYSQGSKNYNSKSYWWESERFHRKALLNYNFAQVEIQSLIMNYEEEIISSIENSISTLNQK